MNEYERFMNDKQWEKVLIAGCYNNVYQSFTLTCINTPPFGVFEFNGMPFELCNAPVHFRNACSMECKFGDCRYKSHIYTEGPALAETPCQALKVATTTSISFYCKHTIVIYSIHLYWFMVAQYSSCIHRIHIAMNQAAQDLSDLNGTSWINKHIKRMSILYCNGICSATCYACKKQLLIHLGTLVDKTVCPLQ